MRNLFIAIAAIALVISFFMWLPEPSAPQPAAWPAQPGNSFMLRGVRAFDGERVRESVDVLVDGGVITVVGDRVRLPDGVPEFAADGHTLLPALLDAHTHNFMSSRTDALRFGVGTQIDMFSDHRLLGEARMQRASLMRTVNADMWSAGMLVTAAGGHGTQFGMAIPTLDDAADADAFIAARIADGSDFIKLVLESGAGWSAPMPTLSRDTLAAAIAAAHAHDKLAVVHVGTLADARAAVAAGADALVHLFRDEVIDDALVADIVARGVFVIPTLAVLESVSGRVSGLVDDARIAPFLTPEQVDGLSRSFPGGDTRAEVIETASRSVQTLINAGAVVLAGSDAPNPGTAHGASLHRELELLVAAGMSPQAALTAATSAIADSFGITDRGRVASGQRADLLLVAGDPVGDITATRDIVAVWKNGYLIERERAGGAVATDTLADPVLGEFDAGADNWIPTTDDIQGGRSEVAFAYVDGALRIDAAVRPGAPWPWAGAMRMLSGTPMAPVDLTTFNALELRLRSDGPVSVLFFSGAAAGSRPQVWPVVPNAEWVDISIPLAEVAGLDRVRVRAIAVVAGPAPGAVRIELDHAVLR